LLHRWLKDQGILDRAQVVHGYPQVIRALITGSVLNRSA
jgi:hypothetical protein